MIEKNENWELEYQLRQFIDVAIRYSIDSVYKSVTKSNPYSIFSTDLKNIREVFDLFCKQLRQRLTETQNWKAIEIDLNERFLIDIEKYLNWYEQNKNQTKSFGDYNPYEILFSIVQSTKKEILKYSDNKPITAIKTPFKDKPTAELFDYIIQNWKYNANTKWGYIWNYFIEKGNGKMPFKIDYETYLIERGLITRGKPNYESCISPKRYNELDELKNEHLEHLDLN
jgi:hypothetical protein